MKKNLIFILLLLPTLLFSQSNQEKVIIEKFYRLVNIERKYNHLLEVSLYNSLGGSSLSLIEYEKLMESISTNKVVQTNVFDCFKYWDILAEGVLKKMGLSYDEAKVLSDYILNEKYLSKEELAIRNEKRLKNKEISIIRNKGYTLSELDSQKHEEILLSIENSFIDKVIEQKFEKANYAIYEDSITGVFNVVYSKNYDSFTNSPEITNSNCNKPVSKYYIHDALRKKFTSQYVNSKYGSIEVNYMATFEINTNVYYGKMMVKKSGKKIKAEILPLELKTQIEKELQESGSGNYEITYIIGNVNTQKIIKVKFKKVPKW